MHLGEDVHLPQHRQQLTVARHGYGLFPVDQDVFGPRVGREDRQVGVQWAVGISTKTPRARPFPGVARRWRAVQARPLRVYGIDAGGVDFRSSHRPSPPVEIWRWRASQTKRYS